MKTNRAFSILSLALFLVFTSCVNYYYIVRHAEKASETDPDPELSTAGAQRALALRDTLSNKNIRGIFVSQYIRTHLTAEPTAGFFGITPVQYTHTLPPAAGIAGLVSDLKAITDKNVLVVGHSDNVPGIILGLTGENVGAITDYDNLFVIRRNRCNNPDRYTLYKRTYGVPSP
ncbi:MAG: phosphoglycerate mutase [Haliscomenobacteraceae bacterium CHB4]|nr:phosphoglycerate mutase [Haliscomenobacteraceae bacterium CHB4]